MIKPNQLRAARALTGLTQDDLAAKLSISTKTLRRAEAGDEAVSGKTISEICTALENEGVEFIPENGGGAGVREKEPQKWTKQP